LESLIKTLPLELLNNILIFMPLKRETMFYLITGGSMLQLIGAAISAFLIVYATVPVLIKVAYLKELYDKPDGERKLHTDYIPTLGGIAIFIAFLLSFSFSGFADAINGLAYFIGAITALFFCGLKDDLVGLSPNKKLLVECISIAAIMFGGGALITSFGGVFGVNEIPIWLSVPISLFTAIVVINAYNLIDGIDGLAGGVGAIAAICFSVVFFVSGNVPLAVMSILLAVTLVGYLFHNFHPANIFMGDTGSLIIGFALSFLAIHTLSLNTVEGFNTYFSGSAAPLVISFLALPLYDTLRVFMRRIKKGESPFSADSDHIHHALLKMGCGQKRTVLYLYASAMVIVGVGFLTTSLNVNISLGLVILSCLLVFPTGGWKRKIASALGLDITKLIRPKKKVDLYTHLEVTNKKKKSSKKLSEASLLD